MMHSVYRAYDTDGELLYIGVTENMARRMTAHYGGPTSGSWWCHDDVTFKAHWVEGRRYAETLEARAIRRYRPYGNRQVFENSVPSVALRLADLPMPRNLPKPKKRKAK